eukprot:GEMP01004903.1.p1 GENE.GEMP01004903.1~~GEMP01004903.1.p1  ORF type:complete len:786 (+),score=124.15 GEMP01004903.1:115-2358(+)
MLDISSKLTNLRIQGCFQYPPRPLYDRKAFVKRGPISPAIVLLDTIWELVFSFLTSGELLRSPTTEVCRSWRDIARSKNTWENLRRRGILFSERLLLVEKVCERRSRGVLWRCGRLYHDSALAIDSPPYSKTIALRRVSLKTVNAGVDDGVPASILRLRASMDALLPHEHILDFCGIELVGEIMEIATKWATFTLRDVIDHSATFLPSRTEEKREMIKRIFFQIFKGLAHMRNKRIIHRNLKPENIFLDCPSESEVNAVVRRAVSNPFHGSTYFENSVVKIGDFSFSRTLDSNASRITPEDPKERERSGREARRTWYRAPELLFRPDTYSYEVDVWSIGCVMAETAIGEALFQSECEIDHLFKVFRLCGSPDPEEWPELLTYSNYSANLPQYSRMGFLNDGNKSKNFRQRREEVLKLEKIRNTLGPLGVDLLDKILTLHPARRITAMDALDHPFFADEALRKPHFIVAHDTLSLMASRSKDPVRPVVPHPDAAMRRRVLEWIIDAGAVLNLSRETTHLAACAYDRVHDVPEAGVSLDDYICVGAVCLKMAEAYQEPSKEYYKQTNFQDYRERFFLARSTDALVQWEKSCWRRLNLHMRISTAWWFYQTLGTLTGMGSRPGEALIELILFDDSIISANISPHLLGLSSFVCGVVLTRQAELLETNPAWLALQTKYSDFFWPANKRTAQEMFLHQLTKSASPQVVRDLKRPSLIQWRPPIGRKSIDGNFPSLPWPLDTILRLAAQPHSL